MAGTATKSGELFYTTSSGLEEIASPVSCSALCTPTTLASSSLTDAAVVALDPVGNVWGTERAEENTDSVDRVKLVECTASSSYATCTVKDNSSSTDTDFVNQVLDPNQMTIDTNNYAYFVPRGEGVAITDLP